MGIRIISSVEGAQFMTEIDPSTSRDRHKRLKESEEKEKLKKELKKGENEKKDEDKKGEEKKGEEQLSASTFSLGRSRVLFLGHWSEFHYCSLIEEQGGM